MNERGNLAERTRSKIKLVRCLLVRLANGSFSGGGAEHLQERQIIFVPQARARTNTYMSEHAGIDLPRRGSTLAR